MKDIDVSDLGTPPSWVAKIAKQGDARIITVPKSFWENGIIDESKRYRVILMELPEKKR